ncbi:MAG: biopolymer transporter ExbD [Gemmatales bacterium]|nr:biopolymer transporter ExbD [Gemmatales bacterium]MDW7993240.1 biopolymer transporter ExbD [Gemmatales bacterium]
MTWRVRHAGSPTSVSLSTEALVEALRDGVYETSDEIFDWEERQWVPIEEHPEFAELAEELESLGESHHEEEDASPDMVPLIDVCQVLLVFFILTMTYLELTKALMLPPVPTDTPEAIPRVSRQQVEQTMIRIRAERQGNRELVFVDGQEVPLEDLVNALTRIARQSRKNEILLEDRGVSWGTTVKILDAATGANIRKVHFALSSSP